MNKFLKVAALGFVLAVSATPAQAVQINFSLDGEVLSATVGNVFGLNVGDMLTMTGTFDDASLTGVGFEDIGFGVDNPTNMLSLPFGTFLIDNTMDINFLIPAGIFFPILTFFDGSYDSMNYVLIPGINGAPFELVSFIFFDAFHSATSSVVSGLWDAQSFNTSTVPEPGTLALLSIGLAGIGLARRRRKV